MDKTAYIFCKSFELNADRINVVNSGENLYIAADSGLETVEKLGIEPDIIIGDFDSVNHERLDKYKNILKYPGEKDDTDTMLCVKYALERGFKIIIIIGGTGGRLDHTLANLALLKYINKHGAHANITDGKNTVFYIKNNYYTCMGSKHKYVSIIPVSPELRGVTLKGFKYNLENAVVKFDEPYTVSNEIAGDYGEITIAEGEAYICECDD